MIGALRRWFIPKPPEAVEATYIALVNAARNPFFYRELHVPDTLDGRFELIVLHLFLLQHRLVGNAGVRSEDGPSEPVSSERGGAKQGRDTRTREAQHQFAQFLSEAFFNDMDASIRELGVADTGVAHRIKRMGKAYHGRLQAYAGALGDPVKLRAALARNLYGTVQEGDVRDLERLADHVQQLADALALTTPHTITSGQYRWPAIV